MVSILIPTGEFAKNWVVSKAAEPTGKRRLNTKKTKMKNKSPYEKEPDMYPEVARWLKLFLAERNLEDEVDTFPLGRAKLSSFLESKNLHEFFEDYLTYEIEVDVLGIIRKKEKAQLAFVECKLKPITLRDISQLLGYSKVAQPAHSLIISPEGLSKSVDLLFNTFRRYDVLNYGVGKNIKIATWNPVRKEIIASTLLPTGEHI